MEDKNKWLSITQTYLLGSVSELECPFCGTGIMKAVDIPFLDDSPEKGGERFLQCSNCEKQQSVLYRKPPDNWLKLK